MADSRMNSSSRIRQFWERFLDADPHSYQRGEWLDLFLGEVLYELSTDSANSLPSDLISFGGSVGEKVCEELVEELEGTWNSNEPEVGGGGCTIRKPIITRGNTSKSHQEIERITNYVLHGRGWRALALLHPIIPLIPHDSVEWCEKLCDVLVRVYTSVADSSSGNDSSPPTTNPYIMMTHIQEETTAVGLDIDKICSFKLGPKSNNKSRRIWHCSGGDESPPMRKGDSSPPQRKISASSLLKRSNKESLLEMVRASSDSEDIFNNHNNLHLKSSTLNINHHTHTEYYSHVARSEGDILLGEAQFLKHHSSGSSKKKLYPSQVKDERVSKVLNSSCSLQEWQLMALCVLQELSRLIKDHSLSVRLLTFSLDNLRRLQFGETTQYGVQRRAAFTKLFLLTLLNVLKDGRLSEDSLNKNTLSLMILLVEDAVSKYRCGDNSKSLQDFILGVVYAIVTTVNSLVFQLGTAQVLGCVRQLVNSFKGRWFPVVVNNILGDRSKSLVLQLSQLVSNLKTLRGRVCHWRVCKKPRHKYCDDINEAVNRRHHDDLLGPSFPSPQSCSLWDDEGSDYCAVGSLFMILTQLLREESSPEILMMTLESIEECGTCCCFPPDPLLGRLLKILNNREDNSRLTNSILSALEKSIYRELGALSQLDESPCLICRQRDEQWSCLDPFKQLLLSSDLELCSSVTLHCLRIVPQASVSFQKRFLFNVFYPAFLTFKKKFDSDPTDRERYGLMTCLSVFGHLLSRLEFARQFLELNGSSEMILDLMMKHGELSALATDIIQALIITRVWSLEKTNCSIVVDDNIKELRTLLNRVEESKRHFLSLIKRLQGSLKDDGHESDLVLRKKSDWEHYMRRLEELNLYWWSLTSLCLNCPQIRDYSTRHLSIECYTLLVYFLPHVAKNIHIEEGIGNIEEQLSRSNELQLKILETLVILSVISPYTGNPGGVFDLKTKLEKVVESKNVGLRGVCEVLLRCSGAVPSHRIVFPTYPIPRLIDLELMNRNKTYIDETNSDSALSGGGSADEGYDADIEVQSIKHVQKECNFSGGSFFKQNRKISYTDSERRFFKIIHPSLCQIVLDLIVYCYRLNILLKDSIFSLHKLGSLIRDKQENCLCLAENSFTRKLLTQFAPLLSHKTPDPIQTELQSAVLEIFGCLARESLHHEELAIFLGYFTTDNPPLESLLGCLMKLLKSSVDRPKSTLKFPDSSHSHAVMLAHDPHHHSSTLIASSPVHKMAISLHNHHLSLGFKTSWSRSSLLFPLGSELGWAMWVHGFSFAMWLNITPPLPKNQPNINAYNKKSAEKSVLQDEEADYRFDADHLLHIISIGYDALVLEFWADATRELLQVRLIRVDCGRLETLSEAIVAEGMLTSRQWHHLALSVHDSIHAGKVIIQVTVIIDGEQEVQVPLTFKGLLVRKARTTCVMLGDTTMCPPEKSHHAHDDYHKGKEDRDDEDDMRGSWMTGGLVMWRRPTMDKPAAQWLASLGPSDLYSTLVQPTVFPLVRQLQESLLLTFRAQSPNIANVYPNPVSVTSLRNINEAERKRQKVREGSVIGVPLRIEPLQFSRITSHTHSSIATATDTLGGLPVFLFLLARVGELRPCCVSDSDEKCRALAVEVYLRLVNSEPHLKSEEQLRNYSQLLSWVLRSGPHPRHHTLNAILDTCCVGDNKEERRLNDAVRLVNLVLGFGSWSYWLGDGDCRSHCLVSLLRWLLELLRDDHPHREYNAQQLNNANFLDALLNFCKESALENRNVLEDRELCGCLVEVIRGVMTAPPRLEHLTSIANYLLLSHPDYATYISHSRTSLYFILPPHPPQSYHNHTKSRPKLGLFSKTENVENKEYRHLFTQPVDATKLNKALTNLQIKEGSLEGPGAGSAASTTDETGHQYYNIYDNNKKEETCDSGIACGSFKNNHPKMDCEDTLSGISANTYFISEPSLLQDNSSSEEHENSTVISEEDVEDDPTNQTNDNDAIPDNTEIPKLESVNENTNGGYEAFRSGLFEILKDQLLMTPDSTLESLLQLSVLTPECFVVMANHHNTNITTAAIKVLEGYWERADATERSRFSKERGFYLLGMQLSSREELKASPQLGDTLAGFVTLRHREAMAHQLETVSPVITGSSSSSATQLNLAALPPLLALLPRALPNVSLAHNIATFLRQLIKVADWKEVLDYGLIEAVLKSIVALMHHSSILADHKILIYTDLQNLLSTVTTIIIQSPGSSSVQSLLDVLLVLEYVFRVETKSCGVLSDCSLRLRTTKAVILQSCLTTVLEIIFSSSQTFKSSFLSSVLSGSSEDMNSSTSSSLNSLSGQQHQLIAKLSRSDLNERFKLVLTEAVHFATYTEPSHDGLEGDSLEGEFVREVWKKVLMSLVSIIERKSMTTRSQWSNIVWITRDTIRSLSSEMFLWLMSPGQSKELRMFTIQSILNEPRSRDVLIYMLSSSQGRNDNVEEVCGLFVRDLLECGALSEAESKACAEFSSRFEEWCIPSVLNILNISSSSSPSSFTSAYNYSAQIKAALIEATRSREQAYKQLCSKIYKCVYKRESLAREVLEYSKRVTRDVVARQSRLRKLQMELMKAGDIINAHTLSKWRQIIKLLTHERAVWHFPQSYPRCWQLDPTEGPSRVRNRLQRCHLNMESRFLKPDYIHKLLKEKEPLSYLFEGNKASMSDILVDRLLSNAKIRHMCQVSVIVPARKLPGELLIGETALYFVPAFNNTSSTLDQQQSDEKFAQLETDSHDKQINDMMDDFIAEEWPFESIKELHRRRYELQERALEIFLLNGRTYLLAFISTQSRDEVMNVLMECDGLCGRVGSEPLCDVVELWREAEITNWEYLMTLNTLAGRSYNDLMQYPVFPFVLADYTSTTLDLNSPSTYRNFKKPMAIQDKKNEQHYINKYYERKLELCEVGNGTVGVGSGSQEERYHYSSHYSNSGTVLHFLLRLPPFTSMFLSYQDNKFDWADRTFHSLDTTWRLTSSESITDVKELIPEFFFLPQFLTNSEGFDFGSKQNGESVDNVVLPPWAKDPRTFILVHRQALESDYVREELAHWIDLVFGYKQVGKAAIESINVFHPSTYYGFDVETIEDALLREARQTMVRTYGQTPKQLFRSSHPIVIQSLHPKHHQPQVIPGVKGLNWGSYVGSPSEGGPVIVWQHQHQVVVASLVPLLTNDVFGLAPNTTLLLSHTKETPLNLINTASTSVLGAALMSWGDGDGVMRVKLRKEQSPFAVIAPPPGIGHHSIAIVASAPDSNQLWIAYTSGKLIVYTYKFDGVGGSLELGKEPTTLVGHRARILAVALSRNFSVALTTDSQGVAILWDMNTLAYIRSLPEISGTPIGLACISNTLGDLATVCDGSSLRVHSINADLIGAILVEPSPLTITSICFSTAPEGTSVNVIAAAISDFTIQLWSSWDLSLVGKIGVPGITKPIISLTYSEDSQQLYASSGDGVVIIWESSSGGANSRRHLGAQPVRQNSNHSKQHKFLNLTSLLS